MSERFFAFVSRHPRGFDVLVALLWTALSIGDDEVRASDVLPDAALIPVMAIAGISLLWRRRFPRYVFGFQAMIVLVLTAIDVAGPVPAAIICGTYSLAAHTHERRWSIATFTAFITAGFATVLITSPSYIPETLVIVLMLSIAWVIGDSLRTRRAYQQSVLDRAERAEALRDSLAQQAVAEERTRIARDLHDVVAHSMSLMVVQAGAARRIAHQDLDASVAAMEAIETVGRNSLGEMRRILGVLRGEQDGATLTPQPDIAAIGPMIDELRAAGLDVTVTHDGDRRPLTPSIELTTFRIVQESLTNTLKHAGPAQATVTLSYLEDTLKICVEDNGRGKPALAGPETVIHQSGGQRGHVGMRERVAAFNGEFTARPRLAGGYQVSVVLPLEHHLTVDQGTP